MNNDKDIFNVQTSILLAAIIISGSLLYSANQISGGSTPTQAAAAAGTAAPAENVKVTARKGAPTEGTGKVVVYEFSDFQCPFCKKFFTETYSQIKQKYIDTGKVTFIYRHYPLSFHQNAQVAAEAGECANIQGKFWPYHDILFTKGESDGKGLDSASLKSYAVNLGLDTVSFNSCLDSHQTAAIVKADFDEGQKTGVSGTPTFFINGKRLVGALPYSEFEKAINEALK